MNELKEWAELVVIPDGLNLREPGSLHQKRIRKIQSLVLEARVNPSQTIVDELKTLKPLSCLGLTPYVSYCRYLQYAISKLDIHKHEGKTESIKGE